MQRTAIFLGLAVILTGCADRRANAPATASDKGGVNIKAPGVEVNVERDGKTDVKAPGVDVKAGPPKTTKRD